MPVDESPEALATTVDAEQVRAILIERGWLDTTTPADEVLQNWLVQAATLLGRFAETREKLADLLGLIFHYDAGSLLAQVDTHAILAREGARTVLRTLAWELLSGGEVDSDRLKEIVARIREQTGWKGRELFHPLRLALAGRAGEGELDRVILLLDAAARLPFRCRVKSTRERILEFCSRLE